MKKYLVFILLILLSCEKDEIIIEETLPTHQIIFDMDMVNITDGQEFSFYTTSSELHILVISKIDGSVISKESFTSKIGINSRKIYTKSLPKETLKLSLLNSVKEEIYKTNIIIE